MAIDKQAILTQLGRIQSTSQGADLVAAGWVKHVSVCDGHVAVKLAGDDLPEAVQAKLRKQVHEAIAALGEGVQQINVEFAGSAQQTGTPSSEAAGNQSGGAAKSAGDQAQRSPQQTARESNPLPDVRHVLAVGAGKGGVGKSTVAVNLAVGLAREGHKVGLLDGDIYGPSTPTLLGLQDEKPHGTNQTLFPFFVHGIKTMTIGKLVDPEKPLVWRGPMAHGAFQQLALQTDWGELDYLIVDLPPGTGDVPLTLAQMLPLSGAIIVCTPQKVAQDDAVRAARMFEQLDIAVLGVIENMSYFIGDDGKEYDIFGRGGAAEMAERLKLPLLGTVPIHMELRANGDAGDPRRNFEGNPTLAEELRQMCLRTVDQLEQRDSDRPSLSISE